MKVFKILFGRLVVGVLVLVGVGLVLPSQLHLQRSTNIQAPPEKVFPLVNDLHAFQRWSPWAERDPQAKYTFAGPNSGVGARMAWASDNPDVGSGSLEIVASDPDRRVAVKLDFGPKGTATATLDLQPEGETTKVTWAFDTDFGYNLVGRYFGLMLPRSIGADYEKGLANLKDLAEGKTGAPSAQPAAGWRMAIPADHGGPQGGRV